MKKLASFLKVIDAISEWSGKGIAYLILPGILILALEVVLRYVFDSPTMWAHGTTQRIFATYYILSGAYIFRYNKHVSVDIVYNRFSLRTRANLSLIGSLFFFVFCGVTTGTETSSVPLTARHRSWMTSSRCLRCAYRGLGSGQSNWPRPSLWTSWKSLTICG